LTASTGQLTRRRESRALPDPRSLSVSPQLPTPPLFDADGPGPHTGGSPGTDIPSPDFNASRASAAAIARRWGVTDQTVYNYAKHGLPHTTDAEGRHWFDPSSADRWRAQHIADTGKGGKRSGAGRKRRSGRKARGSEPLPLVTAAEESAVSPADKEPSDLKGVALQVEREKFYRANLLELEFLEKQGTLVSREKVTAELRAALSGIRAAIERMGYAVSPQVMTVLEGRANPEDQARIQRVLDDFAGTVLDELRKVPAAVGLIAPPAAVSVQGEATIAA